MDGGKIIFDIEIEKFEACRPPWKICWQEVEELVSKVVITSFQALEIPQLLANFWKYCSHQMYIFSAKETHEGLCAEVERQARSFPWQLVWEASGFLQPNCDLTWSLPQNWSGKWSWGILLYMFSQCTLSGLIQSLRPANERRHWLGANLESALPVMNLEIVLELKVVPVESHSFTFVNPFGTEARIFLEN